MPLSLPRPFISPTLPLQKCLASNNPKPPHLSPNNPIPLHNLKSPKLLALQPFPLPSLPTLSPPMPTPTSY
ncbi:hypothetical protein CC80DRAFT_486789 [Byssothecium circinans]|uniref:Uncharacterized protein n=1 Tax=Byssothecium circinans TaxID=147558 RepID=A0A6A5UKF4_9PLEO|nr:hypothetical protein CC80DRAFT_486789 [Byssothecium circinans]